MTSCAVPPRPNPTGRDGLCRSCNCRPTGSFAPRLHGNGEGAGVEGPVRYSLGALGEGSSRPMIVAGLVVGSCCLAHSSIQSHQARICCRSGSRSRWPGCAMWPRTRVHRLRAVASSARRSDADSVLFDLRESVLFDQLELSLSSQFGFAAQMFGRTSSWSARRSSSSKKEGACDRAVRADLPTRCCGLRANSAIRT